MQKGLCYKTRNRGTHVAQTAVWFCSSSSLLAFRATYTLNRPSLQEWRVRPWNSPLVDGDFRAKSLNCSPKPHCDLFCVGTELGTRRKPFMREFASHPSQQLQAKCRSKRLLSVLELRDILLNPRAQGLLHRCDLRSS